MAPTLRRHVQRSMLPKYVRPDSPEAEMARKLSLTLTVMVCTWLATLILGVTFVFVRKLAMATLIVVSR